MSLRRSAITRALDFAERRYGLEIRRWRKTPLFGREYTVVDGTIREPDYDDAWLRALACHSRVVVDIGCNIGQSTLLILSSPSVEEVVLIDANPRALSAAAENLIRNGLGQKARFVASFISRDDDEDVTFFTVGTGAAGSAIASHAKTASQAGSMLSLRTTSLDRLLEKLGLAPDLVKIDVEGAEAMVLQGSRQLAMKEKSLFLVEMHASAELPMAENARRVLDWAESVGYAAWYLKSKEKLTNPGTIAHRGRCHLLLIPEAAPLPEYLLNIRQGQPA